MALSKYVFFKNVPPRSAFGRISNTEPNVLFTTSYTLSFPISDDSVIGAGRPRDKTNRIRFYLFVNGREGGEW